MVVRRTEAEWAEIVGAYKKSGQSQIEFCREQGINIKTFGAHVRTGSLLKTGQRQLTKRSTEEWLSLITEQRSSGENRSVWCKKRGISPDSMMSAEKRLSNEIQTVSKPEWVELNASTKQTAFTSQEEETSWGIRIRGHGLNIEMNANYPVEKLAALLRNLVNPC